jgi:hypothetical protein
MFVPHWKHITFLLRTQQVNAILRFVTTVTVTVTVLNIIRLAVSGDND